MVKLNSLGVKIGAGYVVIVTMLAIVFLVTLSKINEVDQRSYRIEKIRAASAIASLNILAALNRSFSALRGWLAEDEENYRTERARAWRDIDKFSRKINTLAARRSSTIQEQWNILQENLMRMRRIQDEIENIAHTRSNKPAFSLLEEQAAPKGQLILAAITEMMELEAIEPVSRKRNPLFKAMADFRGSMGSAIASIRAFLLLDEIDFKNDFDKQSDVNERAFLSIKQHLDLLTQEQQRGFVLLSQYREGFRELAEKMFQYRQSEGWNIAQHRMSTELAPLEQSVKSKLQTQVEHDMRRMDSGFRAIRTAFDDLISIGSGLLVFAVLASSLLAYRVTSALVRAVAQVIDIANTISRGEFDVEVALRGSDETERLGAALNRMTAVLKQISNHAKRIAGGDYQTDFAPQSENDLLGNSLQQMTVNLQHAKRDSEQQNWLKSGQAGIADVLRGEMNIDVLSENALNYIANYVNAKVGALYLYEDKRFKLTKSFAYKKRRSGESEFALGEGLIGQAALEKKIILFSNIPKEHIHLDVASGLGESVPEHILIVPLINTQTEDNEGVAVIALAACEAFADTTIELVEKASTSIAIAIETSRSRSRLRELLEESQEQAEELQTQQEELKAANEELEEHAQALKQSEEELKAQSDSLQQINAELERKTSDLENQKAAVEAKNAEIESARVELQRKADELQSASTYKSEFLANMSHELRTPLNSLLILSQSMAENRGGNLTDQQVEDARVIYSGGKNLLTLINDILDLSKVEAGKMRLHIEAAEVHHIIDIIGQQFKPIAEDKGLRFIINLEDELPEKITTDGQRVQQILRNLLSNAFKFTQQGSVSLNVFISANGEFGANARRAEQSVIGFSVVDTGIGIDENKQKAVFEAFQQADGSTIRAYGGTGLGLTISRELARLLGGEIHLKSQIGEGSCFTLFLPHEFSTDETKAPSSGSIKIQSDAAHSLAESEETPMFLADDRESIDENDKVVLIVEGDKQCARTLMDLSRERGFKCLVTDKSVPALKLVMEFSPQAVILGMGLPEKDGMLVLDALKASPNTQETPVHIISAEDVDQVAIQRGALGILTKPAELNAIDNVFAKFETLIQQNIKRILLVEDDEPSCVAVCRLLEEKSIEVIIAPNGHEAITRLTQDKFDCCILDLGLPDMTGFKLLDEINEHEAIVLPPTIIYTGRDLSDNEYNQILKYTDKVIIKGECSPHRLHDEVALFLHSVTSNLPRIQRQCRNDPVSGVNLDGRKILLVDDDLRNTYALSKVLNEHGASVTIADNGQLAIERLDSEKDIELVLMDIMMPVMGGYETMRYIREKISESLPIIALTAKAMVDDREKCIQAGANDYLAKPVDIDQLVSMAKVWLYK